MKIALRSYRPQDFDALYAIDRACYASDTAYSRAELRTYLSLRGGDCIVAEVQETRPPAKGNGRQSDARDAAERIIGFCISIHRGDSGHIITMDVLQPWRRLGVGSAILEEIEKRLAAKGVEHVALETATDNSAGIAFWRKRGYRSCGMKRGYYPRGRDAYAMTKSIAASATTEPTGL